MKNKIQKLLKLGVKIIKNNKMILFVILIFILSSTLVNAQIEKTIVALDPQTEKQLEHVNKQIDELRKEQVRNTWSNTSVGENLEEKTTDYRILGYILAGIMVAIWAGSGLYYYAQPQNIKERRKRREEERILQEKNIKMAKKEEERKRQERIKMAEETEYARKKEIEYEELRIKEAKKAEFVKFQELRVNIEQMPRYKRWRKDIIEKCKNMCQMCGSNEKLEVHHLDSFYSIIKQNNIDSIEKAFECKKLWYIENGEVLCKVCHDKMESSIKRQDLLNN